MIEEQASRARGRREATGPNELQPIDGPGGGDNAESASGGAETPVDNPPVGTRQRRSGAAKRKKSKALRRAVERPPEIDSESQIDSSASGHSFGSALEEPLSDQGLESKVQALVSEALEEKLEIQLARLAEMLLGTSAGLARSASDEAQPTVVSRVSGPKADVRPAGGHGDPDPEDSGSDGDTPAGPGLPNPRDSAPRGAPTPGGRRDSVENIADVFGGSDLSKIWGSGGAFPGRRGATSGGWPNREPSLCLSKPPDGKPVTARLFLDSYKKHVIMLSQAYYPLQYYIDDEMKAYIETFYKEENLRFLPEDMQRSGIVSLASLDNRQLIYAAQLCVRPTSREKYLEALRACPRPRKPTQPDEFMNQGAHYNHNMALLNQIQEDIDYLNLNGGIKHMPPLDWSVDAGRVNAMGRKLTTGVARVISEMLSGTFAPKSVIHFRPRTIEEEAESPLPPAPNFGKPNQPKTVSGLIAAYRAIFRYYFTSAEAIKSLREDYDGGRGFVANLEPELPPELRHPTVRTVARVAQRNKEQVLNILQAFAEEVKELLDDVDDEEVDGLLDDTYTRQIEKLQVMTSVGVCYSAMFSSTGECRKPRCT